MGIENIRRWPVYITLAIIILLALSLLNSWSIETELRTNISELTLQMDQCSRRILSCTEENRSILEQRDGYVMKVNDLDKQKGRLFDDLSNVKQKLTNTENKVNRSLIDVDLCKTELQSLKNLQVSKSATLDTLRLEKDTLTAQLTERKQKIFDLEKEIEKLKLALSTKSAPNLPMSSKVTPAALPPKQSLVLNAPQINDIVVDNNDAKEVEEEPNVLSDIDYDPK